MAACFALFRVNSLGDNIIFLNSAQRLRQLSPDAHLVILTNHTSRELYEGISGHVTILTYEKNEYFSLWKNPGAFARLATKLWRFRISACIVGDDQPNISLLLARLFGGRVRVGGQRDWHRVPGALTHCITRDSSSSMMNWSWEITRVFCQLVFGSTVEESPPKPDLSHLAKESGLPKDRIVIHPGASKSYQRWPVENYRDLANRLAEKFPVTWIDDPQAPVEGLDSEIARPRTDTLSRLTQEMSRGRLFIGNNTGPMHLASAIGCPLISISGPSDPAWDPIWNTDRHLILRDKSLPCLPCDVLFAHPNHCVNTDSPMACMKAWSIETLYQRVLEQIARWSPSMDSRHP